MKNARLILFVLFAALFGLAATPTLVDLAKNVKGVLPAANLNVHAILTADRLLITRDALDRIAEVLAS